MNIVIVGAGRIGFNLAQKLIQDKHTVTMIEKDKVKCEGISMSLNAFVINGDGCEARFLEDAEVGRADVVAAVTADDEDNLVICQLAKEVFGVRRTVARVNNPKNEHIFTELGVDVPVNATKIIAKIIEEEVSFEDFINLMTFKRGKLALVRVDLSSDSPIINKYVKDIILPENSVFVTIVRGAQIIVPKGDTVLQKGDDVVALTAIENEQALLDLMIGKVE
ncbi:MAG: NAD-binding protein [Candidatus Omnitrophica bacterium]|nr:NAD-binding protein [Candidatus Omnitrophota bacterium]MBU0880580.1 NAD-binding protein [Candidatus Omnitrophota bacterium]MBU0895223.1 NAD-binding protein [Candidatus Omnitrophota bacterium]MBU1037650.1 NAD-binding protein [Candidatus Omnitrophota bacterium]MBU1808483.1 NAD-binding protein [Candidatus Omnitrophota bacterium]